EFFQDYEPRFEEEFEHEVEAQREETPPVAVASTPIPAQQPSNPATQQPSIQEPSNPVTPQPTNQTPAPLRGAAGKIAQNMELSLSMPTATSIRNIPVKVLEENRRVVNNHLALTGQPKASFPPIIAWALVNAVKQFPRMNAAFATQDDNTPVRIDRNDINLG